MRNLILVVMLTCLFAVAISAKNAQCCLADDFADRVLLVAVQIAESLPPEQQCIALCKTAIEYDRRGQKDKAQQLSEKAIELFRAAENVSVKDKMATSIAIQKIRAGDLETAKSFTDVLSDGRADDNATYELVRSLCEESKFQIAIQIAEKINKRNPVRFDAMEHIARNSATAGDYTVSARAARGMDPYGDEYAIRKMRWLCEECQILWKSGERDLAKESAEQVKAMKILIDQDPATLAMVELNWAAVNDENLVAKWDEVLRKLDSEVPADKHRETYRALSAIVVVYDRLEFATSLLAASDNAELKKALAFALASKFADDGMVQKVEERIRDLNDKIDLASVYLRLANAEIEQGKAELAKNHTNLASDCLRDSGIPNRVGNPEYVPVFLRLIATYARLGEGDKATQLLATVDDKKVALDYSLELAREVPKSK